MPPFVVNRAAPRDLRTVLRIVLAGPGQTSEDVELQVTAFIHFARELSLSLDRLWLATAQGRPLAACACLQSPGRTSVLLLPSGLASPVEHAVLHALAQAAAEDQTSRGTRLLQCLLEPDDDWTRSALHGAGFRDLATLRYLERTGRHPPMPPANPLDSIGRRSQWITYGPQCHDDFTNLIAATYEGSLDCPGLYGLRDIEDVVAGHKSAGRFDPRLWLLLKSDRADVGCILFGVNPVRDALELVYMGVHPGSRGRGLGRYMLNHSLALPQAQGFAAVTVAVDADNTPAAALYEGSGFVQTHRRRALIRLLSPSPGAH
jgi:ribosomal protein S18 acetylase RimI-like enzyme